MERAREKYRGKKAGEERRAVKREYELEKREKNINKKAGGRRSRRRRKGGRGSIHSNSVVKATACPTARRYLWGGFWVASVAADVTADRVPPPPRCPLFCFCSLFSSSSLRRSVRPIRHRDSTSSEEKGIFQAIPLGHTCCQDDKSSPHWSRTVAWAYDEDETIAVGSRLLLHEMKWTIVPSVIKPTKMTEYWIIALKEMAQIFFVIKNLRSI